MWLTEILATNLLDAAKATSLLPESWPFASGDYRSLCETTSRYAVPAWLNGLLFARVICWEALATLLFWIACWTYRGRSWGGGHCTLRSRSG